MQIKLLKDVKVEKMTELLNKVGVDKTCINDFIEKMVYLHIYIENLKPAAANIIKQTMLSVGSDAAVNRGAINCSVEYSDCLIFGSIKQIKQAAIKLEKQPFGLKEVSKKILSLLEEYENDCIYPYSKE